MKLASKFRVQFSVLALSACVLAPSYTTVPLRAQTSAGHAAPKQDLEKEADTARERGDTQASLKLYERALAHRPTWQEGWWYYGSLQYDGNQYEGAVHAFRKVVALNDQLADAWGMLGLSEFETRDYDHALPDLRKAEHLRVTDPSLEKIVDYHLALLLNSHGDSDGALLLLSSLYLKGVHSEDLQVAMGLSLLRVPVFPSDLDPSRDALVHDAGSLAALLASKQYEKADVAFQGMLARYPQAQFIHYAYGGMLASQGHDAAAEKQFKAEVQLNPDNVLTYLEWAFVAMKNKDYPESKRLATKAVELNGDSFLAHYILGNSLLQSGDAKAALPELETAKRLSPQSPDVRYSLSRTYARLGESTLAKQEQSEFLTLQKKNAMDRLDLQKRYPSAQPITGIRPTTSQ